MTMAPLPEAAKFKHFCPVCRAYATALYQGACWLCAIKRYDAVLVFIRAADQVREMGKMGATITADKRRAPGGRPHHPLTLALDRLARADAECVRLGLWKSERTTRRPPWFYGDERSNTR